MTIASVQPVASQRERNKLDKLRRIKDASLELFLSKGYDDTTTREIAALAGVGLGTVFVYAETKRDLLFLIVNDDLESTVEAARQSVRADCSVLENLLMIVRRHYALVARQPDIWRLALREMYFYASGVQAKRFLRTRERLIHLFIDIVADGKKRGIIRSKEDNSIIGWMIFALYQIDIRRFLMQDDRNIESAVKQFARQLKILMVGLSAMPEALALKKREGRK